MAQQRYTTERRDGCTLVFGSMPVTDLVALTKGAGDQVMSPDLARLAGAQFAWGLPEDVDALSDALRQSALASIPTPDDGGPWSRLSDAEKRWLAAGEQGLSSCAIVFKLTGYRPEMLEPWEGYPYPHDPDDLRRCLLLLRDVPDVASRIGEMASCSPQWAALVGAWGELSVLFSAELPSSQWEHPPRGAKAPKTYARMRELLDPVRRASATEAV